MEAKPELTPCSSNCSLGPIPDLIRMAGEDTAPAQSTTSNTQLTLRTVLKLLVRYSTPDVVTPLNNIYNQLQVLII